MFSIKEKTRPLLFGLLLIAVGCGVQDGFAPGAASPYFLYMASITNRNLAAYSIDLGRGTLKEVPGSPFSAGSIDVFSATDPNGKFLYVADSSGSLYGFTIKTNGALVAMAGSPFTIPQPSGVAVDPSGRFLFVSDGTVGSCAIHGYSINQTTGVPTATVQGSFSVGTSLETIVASPTGTFLFATDLTDGIYSLKYDAAGAVSTVNSFAAGTGAESVVVDPTGQYLYSVAINGGLYGFTINSGTGALVAMAGSPYATTGTPQTVSVHPTGLFVYVMGQTPDTIRFYRAGSGGALTFVGSIGNTGPKPSSGSIDPTGKYLFVADDGPGISIYNILMANGGLVPVTSAAIKTNTSPFFALAMKKN